MTGRARRTGGTDRPVIDTEAVEAEVVETPPEPPVTPGPRPVPEAGRDMAALSAAHRAFAEGVMQAQRRNTLLAAGAAGGAVVAVVLAGMVYFRSVEDLRIAAAVQSDAARLLVEEVQQIDGIGDTVEEQQARLKDDLLASLELVKDEVRRAAMTAIAPEPQAEAMDAQIATAIRDGVKADMGVMRDEILTALAQMEMELLNGTADPAMAELLAGVKALVATAEPPAPVERTAARSASPAKPRAKPQPAEPSPFTYP